MKRASRASILGIVSLVVASCAGSAGDSSNAIESVGEGPAPASPVAVTMEQRFGSGRAVAAASNGIRTVVATTSDIAVSDGAAGPFRVIAGAAEPTRDIGMSPDGERLTIVTNTGGLEIWSTDDAPSQVAGFAGVDAAEFRPDGSLVVVGGDVARIVDVVDGSTLDEWVVPSGRSLGPFAVADDGRIVMSVAGGSAPAFATWSEGVDPLIVEVDVETVGDVEIVRIVTVGDRVALGLEDSTDSFEGQIAVSTIGAGEPAWSIEFGSAVDGGAWSLVADGSLLIGQVSTMRFVDENGVAASSPQTITPIERVTPDGLVVLSNGSILRFERTGLLREVSVGSAPVIDLHIEPSSGVTTVVDTTGQISAIAQDANDAVLIGDFVAAALNDVAVAADGRIATASAGGIVELRSGDGATLGRLVHDEGSVDSVVFSQDGTELASGVAQRRTESAWDDTLSLWDVSTSERIFEVGGEAEEVAGCSFFTNRVRFSNDGSFVVSLSHDFTVAVIAVPSGELLHTFAPHANTVLDVAISPDGTRLVTSGDDSTMRVWDLETYELLADHATTMGGFWSLSFLADATSVVAGDLSGNLSVVDVMTGAATMAFESTKLRQARSAVSPDGQFVAAGAEGSSVRIWSTETGDLITELVGHGAAVSAVAFSADSSRLVSASQDGTTIVWVLMI